MIPIKTKSTLILVSACLALLLPLNASALSIFSITNGDGIVALEVDPLSNPGSATDFFGWGNLDFAENDTGFIWLYENTDNGDISLGFLIDKYNHETPSSIHQVKMTFSGAPEESFVELSDDPGEVNLTGANWWYNKKYVDGGVIGGLNTGAFWEMTISLNQNTDTGISSWYFLSGDPTNPDKILLDMTHDLIITDPPVVEKPAAPVPEPSSIFLVLSGLAGLGFYRKWKQSA